MNKETTIITAWELYEQGFSKTKIATHLGVHRNTVHHWVTGITASGMKEYLKQYEIAKKHPKPWLGTPMSTKQLIWKIREKENNCCGQKIQYYLRVEHGVELSVETIYKVLRQKYVIRSKWKKNKQRGKVPTASKAREVVQMDTVDFGNVYAFTGVDIFSREVDVYLAPSLESVQGKRFLEQSMKRRFDGYVQTIQTDGGPEFKKDFKQSVSKYCERYRVSRPYRKNEQSYIESFNRTLRKECLGWGIFLEEDIPECTKQVEEFLYNYHYRRPHMGLNMKTPVHNF